MYFLLLLSPEEEEEEEEESPPSLLFRTYLFFLAFLLARPYLAPPFLPKRKTCLGLIQQRRVGYLNTCNVALTAGFDRGESCSPGGISIPSGPGADAAAAAAA